MCLTCVDVALVWLYELFCFQIVSCGGTRHPAGASLVKGLLTHDSGSKTHMHQSVSDGSCLTSIDFSAVELLTCLALHGELGCSIALISVVSIGPLVDIQLKTTCPN